jgi:hypothetical protein
MSDDEADGALESGQEESMLGKNGSEHNILKARFDTITAEEGRLLKENIGLGNAKGNAARRKFIIARLEEINVEAAFCKIIL